MGAISGLFLAAALALETDQFTTPLKPLDDLGPRMSRKVVAIIESDRTGRDPEEILARWIGHNVFESRIARWIRSGRPTTTAVTFRPAALRSVYQLAFSPVPASFLADAPTINIHGYYMGTDKLDHFFQQGHEYFELVRLHEAMGTSQTVAIAHAVQHGVHLEHTYFGTLTTGVFSNADLAANYAGMKFYLNLRHPVRIGDRIWPALFEHTSQGWRLREGADPERLLEPFLSNHLDESLNPSRYRFSRRAIRSAVQHRCEAWTQFYAHRLDLVAPSGESFAATWFGEDYGHWLPANAEISIATECRPTIARARADMLISR